MVLVLGVWTYLRALVGRATAVALENVALRHQLAILQRTAPCPRLRRNLLGLPLTPLGELAGLPPHYSARDRPCLAPPRLPALLALEVPAPLSGPPPARS